MKIRTMRRVVPGIESLDVRVVPSALVHHHAHAHLAPSAHSHAITTTTPTPTPVPALAPGLYTSTTGTITSSIYHGLTVTSSLTLTVAADYSVTGSLMISYPSGVSTTGDVITSEDTFTLQGIVTPRNGLFLGGSGSTGSFFLIGHVDTLSISGRYFFIGNSKALPDTGVASFPLTPSAGVV